MPGILVRLDEDERAGMGLGGDRRRQFPDADRFFAQGDVAVPVHQNSDVFRRLRRAGIGLRWNDVEPGIGVDKGVVLNL